MKQILQEIAVGIIVGTMLGVAIMMSAIRANASPGYDPTGDGDVICRLMDAAQSVDDVEDLVAVYGAQDVTDYVYAGCNRNSLKIIAALTHASST